MGFLGWTYDQVLNTPFGAIDLAFEGRVEMLRSLAARLGGGEEAPPEADAPPSPEAVKAAFRSISQ